MAGITKCPELELDDDEAKKITLALDRLAEHYNVQPTPTQKVWANFIGAMGTVYGTRAVAIYTRLKKGEKKSATIIPIVPKQPAE